MNISIPDKITVLIIAGLFFVFVSLVNINRLNGISFNVPHGNKKYLIFFGILIIIAGILLPANDSQQKNDTPTQINNTNTLIQTINSEQKPDISEIFEIDENINKNIESNNIEPYI